MVNKDYQWFSFSVQHSTQEIAMVSLRRSQIQNTSHSENRAPSSKPAARCRSCWKTGQTDTRTDGRTPDRYIDPAPHIMRAASKTTDIAIQQQTGKPTAAVPAVHFDSEAKYHPKYPNSGRAVSTSRSRNLATVNSDRLYSRSNRTSVFDCFWCCVCAANLI